MGDVRVEIDGNLVVNAITAVATAATALFAWLRHRQGRAEPDPVVECTVSWADHETLRLWLVIRNRADATLTVWRTAMLRPGGSVMRPDSVPVQEWADDDRQVRTVRPHGSERTKWQGGDVDHFGLLVRPPSTWRGGKLLVVLMMSFNVSTTRHRRMTVHRVISAPPQTKTLDTKVKT